MLKNDYADNENIQNCKNKTHFHGVTVPPYLPDGPVKLYHGSEQSRINRCIRHYLALSRQLQWI